MPYNPYKLDQITIFKGKPNQPTIELSRTKQYINLIKEEEKNKRYYRLNLQTGKFERINFYKTVSDKITEVKVENITKWFSKCTLMTKDIHFGRLIIFAKYNRRFERYRNPVRFVEQLNNPMIKAIEEWEAIGIKLKEVENFFEDHLKDIRIYINGKITKKDFRKAIYTGELDSQQNIYYYRLLYYGTISLRPSDIKKNVLDYIKKNYDIISNNQIRDLNQFYGSGQFQIEEKLKWYGKQPEFTGIFHYDSEYSRDGRKWVFGTSNESKTIKRNLIQAISDYNLDIPTLLRYLKKQANVENNTLSYFFGPRRHYADYLECEYDLKDGRLSKMTKYPENFRTEFHKTQTEYNIKKEDIDKKKFKKIAEENKKYEYKGKKYQIIVPHKPEQIHHEANELGHCVRTYIPRVIKRQTLILFLRHIEHPEEPLITLEVKNNILTQAYGHHDSKPKTEHLKFLREWTTKKHIEVGCWKNSI